MGWLEDLENTIQPNAQAAQPQTAVSANSDSTNLLGGAGALAKGLALLPEQLAAKAITAVGGSGMATTQQDKGMLGNFVDWTNKRVETLTKEYENAGNFVPGIKLSDVAQLVPNLAFSGVSMGGTIGGGAVGSLAGPGGTVAGGLAGGTATAYRMDSYQAMQTLLDKKNQESLATKGMPLTLEEEAKLKNDFSSFATKHGMWEAIPEAVGNVAELALWSKIPAGRMLLPKGAIGKALNIGGKALGTVATEMATETPTQMGQQRAESEVGLADEAPRSFTNPADWYESAKEVLPQVLLLSGFMSGVGGIGSLAYDKHKQNQTDVLVNPVRPDAEDADKFMNARAMIADSMANVIESKSPEVADLFRQYAEQRIANNKPIEPGLIADIEGLKIEIEKDRLTQEMGIDIDTPTAPIVYSNDLIGASATPPDYATDLSGKIETPPISNAETDQLFSDTAPPPVIKPGTVVYDIATGKPATVFGLLTQTPNMLIKEDGLRGVRNVPREAYTTTPPVVNKVAEPTTNTPAGTPESISTDPYATMVADLEKGMAEKVSEVPQEKSADPLARMLAESQAKGNDTPMSYKATTSASVPELTKPAAPVHTPEEITAHLTPLHAKLKNAGNLQVVNNESGVPVDVAERSRLIEYTQKGENIFGFFDPQTKTTYVLSDNISSKEEATKVYTHEVIGHMGVMGVLNKAERHSVFKSLLAEYKDTPIMNSIIDNYTVDMATPEGQDIAAKELIAHIAQQTTKPTVWQKIVRMVRMALKRMGLGNYNESQIEQLIRKSWAYAEKGLPTQTQGTPLASKQSADTTYLEAVKRGDMDTAQKMVDERLAAKGAFWHGTPSGDLRGGRTGLHVGTKQAAMEALEARIGIPADGKGWDGTREYGKTLLAGRTRIRTGQFGKYRESGYNTNKNGKDLPDNDFYPSDYAIPIVGDDVSVDLKWKPWIRPVLIVGEMSKRKKTDSAANSSMYKLLKKGEATEGFYYKNEGEDFGSVSAVLPNGEYVKVKLPDPVTYDNAGNVIPLSKRFNDQTDDIRFSKKKANFMQPTADAAAKKSQARMEALHRDKEPDANREVPTDSKGVITWLQDQATSTFRALTGSLKFSDTHIFNKAMTSPEYYRRAEGQAIFNLMGPMRDEQRNEIMWELDHHIKGDDKSTISDLEKNLKKKNPKGYAILMEAADFGDTKYVRDKKVLADPTIAPEQKEAIVKAQWEKFEKEVREQFGATDDVIEVLRARRHTMDKGFELSAKVMQDRMKALDPEGKIKKLLADIKQQQKYKRNFDEITYAQRMEKMKADLALLPNVKEYQGLSTALTEIYEVKGFYEHRARPEGDFRVEGKLTDGGLERLFMTHGSRKQMELLKIQMEREGWAMRDVEDVRRFPESAYENVRQMDTAKLLEVAMNNLAKREGASEESIDAFNRELIQEVSDVIKVRGARSSAVHRRTGTLVEGYIRDPQERRTLYASRVSNGISKADAVQGAMNIMLGTTGPDGKKTGGIDPIKDKAFYELMRDFLAHTTRNSDRLDRMLGMAKSVAALKYLTSPKTIIGNTTALVLTVPTALHAYAGAGKVSFYRIFSDLIKGLNDYTRVMAGKYEGKDADEQAMIKEFKQKGYDKAQFAHEISGNIQGAFGKTWAHVMKVAMYGFQKSEQWIRGGTTLAAYRIARGRGAEHKEALEVAHHSSNRAHAQYGTATDPKIAQGGGAVAKVAKAMLAYAKFGHSQAQMLKEVGFDKKDRKAFAYGIIAPLVFAGGMSFPLKWAIFAMLKPFMDDKDPEKSFWDWVRNLVGSKNEKYARYGILGALGTDMSSSVGFMGSEAPAGTLKSFGGAPLQAVMDVAEGGMALAKGNIGKAIDKMAPAPIRRGVQAYRDATEGMKANKERPVFDEAGKRVKPTTVEAIAQGIGFNSAEKSLLRQRTQEAKAEEKNYQETRDEIYTKYREYLLSKDRKPSELKEVMGKVKEYNNNVVQNKLRPRVSLITQTSLTAQARSVARPDKKQMAQLQGR